MEDVHLKKLHKFRSNLSIFTHVREHSEELKNIGLRLQTCLFMLQNFKYSVRTFYISGFFNTVVSERVSAVNPIYKKITHILSR